MTLLDREFARGVPETWSRRRPGYPAREWLSPTIVRYIVWERSRGTPVAEIARRAGCTERAIYARLASARADPLELLLCRTVERVYMPHLRGADRWYCLWCGHLSATPQKAGAHAWRHVFGPRRGRSAS